MYHAKANTQRMLNGGFRGIVTVFDGDEKLQVDYTNVYATREEARKAAKDEAEQFERMYC